jgi:hypothetical protein
LDSLGGEEKMLRTFKSRSSMGWDGVAAVAAGAADTGLPKKSPRRLLAANIMKT